MKYKIPITWQSYQNFEVEAETLQEAILIAVAQFMKIPDDNYLDDSWDIDSETINDNYPNERYDLDNIKDQI